MFDSTLSTLLPRNQMSCCRKRGVQPTNTFPASLMNQLVLPLIIQRDHQSSSSERLIICPEERTPARASHTNTFQHRPTSSLLLRHQTFKQRRGARMRTHTHTQTRERALTGWRAAPSSHLDLQDDLLLENKHWFHSLPQVPTSFVCRLDDTLNESVGLLVN